MKFQRTGKTDQDTMMSLSGDEIIGDIIHNNMALIPIPVTPHGSLGALFNRFLSNTTVGQPPSFSTSRPNATAAYDIARSRLVPKGLFQHADRLWQQHNPETAHSGSYRAYTPSANYNQRIGLILSTSISSHLKRCHHKNAHAREQRISRTYPIPTLQCAQISRPSNMQYPISHLITYPHLRLTDIV